MRIEKISSSQLFFLIAGQIQGGTLLVSTATKVAMHDTWLALLAGFLISLPWVWMYGTLLEKFPGKNLVQIHNIIYGPYVSKLVSVLYIWFYLSIDALLLRVVGGFTNTYLLPETPVAAILILFMFLCAWSLRYGMEVIARCSFMFVVITLLIGILTFTMLVKDMKFTNFLPVFEVPVQEFIHGSLIIGSGCFQWVVFLMIAPYLNNIKEVKKAMLMGVILGGIYLLIIAVRNTAVLGILEPIQSFASYRAVSFINVADIFNRVEVLVSVVLLITLFMRVCLNYYATILATAQLLGLRSYLPLIFPFGSIIVSLAILAFDSSAEAGVLDVKVMLFYSLFFEFVKTTGRFFCLRS